MSVSLIDGTLVNRWPTAWVGTGAVGQSVARIGEGPRHGGGSALLGEIISFVGGAASKRAVCSSLKLSISGRSLAS